MKNSILKITGLFALILSVWACSSIKVTSVKEDAADGKRKAYIINMEKDAQATLYMAEVQLFDAANQSKSATFQVLDGQNNPVMNLKGYGNFVIKATISDPTFEAVRAIVYYRETEDGPRKSKAIKPLLKEEK